MADLNKVKKLEPVMITLTDGIERELKFTLNSMAELEDRYGSVEEAFNKLESQSFKAIRFIIWAGLLSNKPMLSEEQVGDLLDMVSITEISSKLGQALGQDLPSEDEVVAEVEGAATADPKPTLVKQ